MKRTRLEMQADEQRKIYDVLSDVDNASKEDLESIVTSIFPGEERRCFEEIKSRAFQYLERKNQSDADELADWFVSKADKFRERFGKNELRAVAPRSAKQ